MIDAMGAGEALPGWLYSSTQHAELEAVRRARLQESPVTSERTASDLPG